MITETDVKIETPSFCDECGASIPPGSRFCNKCGKAVSVPQPEPPVETPAAPEEEVQEAAVTVSEPVPEPEPIPTAPEPAPEQVVPASAPTLQTVVPTPPPTMPPVPPAPPEPPVAPGPPEVPVIPVPPAAPETRFAEEAPKEKKPKKAVGIVSTVLTYLLCVLLVPCALLFMVLLMIRIYFPDAVIPTMAGMDGSILTTLTSALYPLIISGVLIVLFLVLVIVLNRKRFRRVFLALGLSVLILSLLSGLAGIFADAYMAPFQLDASLTREYIIFFRELNLFCSTICTGIGLFSTMVYLCIAAVKRDDA